MLPYRGATSSTSRQRRPRPVATSACGSVVGRQALQMLMTGDPITAQEAYRLGMVNELCSQGELLEVAGRIADKIASNSPTAV